ncbi:MAG: ribose-5-phosphate isomerase RpiA [Candidatus Altiarchaeales archaeon]|nr:ribose-5-phosphate isomerase RpiA [Candidatus Altiarchaeota archaeon]MBU4265837.1 ribose-5-phosphate isomerase RpiA [Candidatus Altiarchaeota archaeon]MBU4342002.1 ribose-5-phosphate isomerase RpiA [Candidatus Altiarchaeota archaeon]MBU4406206.1 ribose-5-phosphate isomerase RpiA [Candidatus Altiarchaeota archaeon]MCG2783017.1 ribose-5-phosphate isomerase RpiA [Candidatus Altiarchaeales archaeon]
MDLELSKKSAAAKALEYVEDGMVLGLGTGSTANYFIELLAEKIKEGNLSIIGIPTSTRTKELALGLGIELSTLEQHQPDLDVDGADQIDAEFNLIKGGGGAHTREKKVATASKRFIVIADPTKLVDRLDWHVPIEVLPHSREQVEQKLLEIGGKPELRENFTTDGGNLILDTKIEIPDALELESRLNSIPGVIDNGIFAKRRPELVIMGKGEGTKVMER